MIKLDLIPKMLCPAYRSARMGTAKQDLNKGTTKKSPFEKVGECLYGYTPNGTYYARIEKDGKEFRKSLRTTDRALARRKLADFQRELGRAAPGANKITLERLRDMHLETQAASREKHARG